ncbi:hypothetical protein BSKO_03816 [Bryopsis sp. KO-2023]|nr:hypothetical protein BSKO_03816 [Bryopsis sp. KO-2023]
MIVCAAVVGQANNPLFIKCFADESGESALKFHYVVHCALDAVEEKVYGSSQKKGQSGPQESYLGLLYPTEDYKVLGYITNTNVKFILVVDDLVLKEDDIRRIFKRIHHEYVNAVSNAFYTFGTRIDSPMFEARIRALVKGRS